MVIAGRRRELDAMEMLLERAGAGLGGVLVLAGPAGSGRTALVEAAATRARHRGFQVLRVATAGGGPGRWAWARLLRDAGAPDELVARMLAEPGPLDLDAAAVALCAGPPRLVLLDDVERGGAETTELLAILAGRAAAGQVAVVATSCVPLGVGPELWLGALSPEEIGAATGEDRPDVRHALWTASRGLPGPARSMAVALAALPPDADPVVQLALRAESAEGFLAVDNGLVVLAETALQRAADDQTRARLLARLAYWLLGDASAAGRRRALVHDAVALARRSLDPAVLAEVLDARLHALWDPEGASDRHATAAEIIELARASADLARERRGLFWRFVALMELGRVAEAETALAAFEREARSAGDAQALVMAIARHAMLATLRGRFGDAHALIEQVSLEGRKVGLADTEALVGTMRGTIAGLRGDSTISHADVQELRRASRQTPGHLHEATTAWVLLASGDAAQAALELERALPLVL
ncbi:MAG: ATP-binding protein, partial [Actinomycetota bacterium]